MVRNSWHLNHHFDGHSWGFYTRSLEKTTGLLITFGR